LEKVKENYSGQVQELREQLVYVKNREQKLQEALQRR